MNFLIKCEYIHIIFINPTNIVFILWKYMQIRDCILIVEITCFISVVINAVKHLLLSWLPLICTLQGLLLQWFQNLLKVIFEKFNPPVNESIYNIDVLTCENYRVNFIFKYINKPKRNYRHLHFILFFFFIFQ